MRTHTTLARPLAILGLAALLASACQEATNPAAPVVPTAPSLAKGGPKVPPTNGRIYFTSSFAGGFDVYSMKPDGTDRLRLTLTADEERYVAVSPDGKKLVVGNRRANSTVRELLTMNVDGTNRRVVLTTDAPSTLAFPEFSPDGRVIAYTSNLASDPDTYGIWMVTLSGGKVTRLTPPSVSALYASWSPDGSRIVYAGGPAGSGEFDLYIMNADGSAPQLLHDCEAACSTPVWSPDGSQIIYTTLTATAYELRSCMLLNAVPECGIRIANDGTASAVALSPDGSQLVYAAQTWENDAIHRVLTANINGSGQSVLTANLFALLDVAWGR